MEVNQLNLTVEIFNQRRATLDPITGIQINNVPDGLDLRAMDVAANHTVHILFLRRLDDRVIASHIVHHSDKTAIENAKMLAQDRVNGWHCHSNDLARLVRHRN